MTNSEKAPNTQKRASWTRDELVRVAELYYKGTENLSQEQIGKAIGRTRADVNRMLKKAEEEGIVAITISDPRNRQDLRELEWKLRDRFKCLTDAIVVPGHQSLTMPKTAKGVDIGSLRAGVVFAMAQAASDFISRNLSESATVAVGQGEVVKMAVSGCRVPRPLFDLRIVPMAGYSFSRYHPQGCGVIAEELARLTSGQLWWLPVPSMVSRGDLETVNRLPIVRKTLDILEETTMVIANVGPITDAKIQAYVEAGFFSHDTMCEVLKKFKTQKAKRPAGEICGWYYDDQGEPLSHDCFPLCSVGIGIEKIKQIVSSKSGKVIVIGGAQQARVKSIEAALRGNLLNVLITDDSTAQILLKK